MTDPLKGETAATTEDAKNIQWDEGAARKDRTWDTYVTEVEFVHPVSPGGSVKFLPAV